jgi:hypothetical protein
MEDYVSYQEYVSKGIFRPDFMPLCREKSEWWKFFNVLSHRYVDDFTSITAAIYLSESFFEAKQGRAIRLLRDKRGNLHAKV